MAIGGLICGICAMVFGIVLGWTGVCGYVGVVCGIVGIILSIKGKKQTPEKSGMCTAGLVLSIIGLVFGAIFAIACSICVAAANEVVEQSGLSASEWEDLANALSDLN